MTDEFLNAIEIKLDRTIAEVNNFREELRYAQLLIGFSLAVLIIVIATIVSWSMKSCT